MAANPKNYLLIVNGAPYPWRPRRRWQRRTGRGNEHPYNALRLALNLVKRPEVSVCVFLIGYDMRPVDTAYSISWRGLCEWDVQGDVKRLTKRERLRRPEVDKPTAIAQGKSV